MTDAQSIEDAPLIAQRDIKELLQAEDSGPCITIYVDTLPQTDEKDKNRIRYKDQIKAVGEALEARDIDKRTRAQLIDQLEHIGQTEDFWLYQQYGLAVFLSQTRLMVRKLMGQPGNLAVVADAFHLRPALQITRNAMRHHILCVSVDRVELYESDGQTIARVDLHPDVPTDMSEAIGQPARVHKADTSNPGGDESDQLRRYFQHVDEAIRKHHSRLAKRPLLLTTLAEHQGLFREVSGNPQLLDTGLDRDPFHGLSENELAKLAWEQVETELSTNLDRLVERFNSELAHDRGAKSLQAIAAAAIAGQVETLLIEENRRVGGHVDPNTGELELQDVDEPHTNDAIDEIAALALQTDSELLFLPPERMPSDTGAAAIFRFAT